jgi:hypothetical protein
VSSKGGFAPLSTVVARLTARSSLLAPRIGLRGESPHSNMREVTTTDGR